MTPRGRGGGSNSVDTDAGNRKTGPFQASSWVANSSQKPVFAAYDEPGRSQQNRSFNDHGSAADRRPPQRARRVLAVTTARWRGVPGFRST